MRNRSTISLAAGALVLGAGASLANAASVTYDGITFPEGDASFADQVVEYDPTFSGGNAPTGPGFTDPLKALGAPDTGAVSLGSGGRLVLDFTDNVLTGSDDDTPDLHVFEIGNDVEDTFVDVSENGIDFTPVGKVSGGTSSIDIDAFGFDSSSVLGYVRLTDDPQEGQRSGSTVGADIDAVGAISSSAPPPTPNGVPTPTAAFAGLAGLGALALRRRR